MSNAELRAKLEDYKIIFTILPGGSYAIRAFKYFVAD